MQIEINNVSFSYGKNEKLALDNVSFNVSKGDFLCIVGKTGSGKSTLIQMLNGLLLPDKGYIKVDDYIITSDKKLKKSLLKDKSKEIKKINKRMVELKKKVGLISQFLHLMLVKMFLVEVVDLLKFVVVVLQIHFELIAVKSF